MLVQCGNCGAPLDARPNSDTIKCNYCGVSHAKQRLAVQNQEVPRDWRPPTVWVPPAEYGSLAGQNLSYQRAAAGMRNTMVAIILGPIVLGFGGTIISVIAQAARRTSMGTATSPDDSWDGKSTLKCGNGDAKYSGITTSNLGVAVQVSGTCHVDISGSTLRADKALMASDSGKIVVHGGTLRATQKGMRVEGNSTIELHDVHIVVGAAQTSPSDIVAVEAASYGSVDLYNCTIEIEHGGLNDEAVAADVDTQAKITFHGGKVTGRYRLTASQGGVITALGADISGRVEVSSPGAKITGVHALDADSPHAGKRGHGRR